MPDPNIIAAIKAEAKRRGVPYKHLKAAIETGLVESNLQNLPGGDRDSAGWRQERASLYRNPTNVQASVRRFFDEAAKLDRPGLKSGELAALVQRPAEQYRGRYGERAGEAAALLKGGSYGSSAPGKAAAPSVNPDAKRELLQAYISNRHNPNALLELAAGLKNLKPEATSGPTSYQSADPSVDAIKSRASAIDRQKLPYQWGGGHGPSKPGQPLDCSGAVSKVLGIDPRVSGEFEKWGKPGKGKVTIYANKKHVLMEIDGHFFGTSATNPGGGAGWIPRSAISEDYLKGFKARHA